jgi:hypothetical protein
MTMSVASLTQKIKTNILLLDPTMSQAQVEAFSQAIATAVYDEMTTAAVTVTTVIGGSSAGVHQGVVT